MRLACVPLLLVFSSCLAAARGGHLPVPDGAEQVEAKTRLNEMTAKSAPAERADPIALARTYVAQSKDKADDPALRFVMLREAVELAARAGDVDGASAAVTEIARLFAVSPLAATIHAMILLERAPVVAGKTSVADFAFGALDVAIAHDDYDAAADLMRLAAGAAAKRKDPALTDTIASRTGDVQRLRAELQRVRPDIALLRSSPDNAEACNRVGRFFCFFKGDWDAGLPLLAKGKDEALKGLAQKELRDPTDLATRCDLANAWWKVAADFEPPLDREIRIHSGAWYRLVVKDLNGYSKIVAEARIAQTDKLTAGRPAPRLRAASNWTVVFRADDPSIWNTEVNDGKRLAKPLDSVPADRVRYLKITETQSSEFVIIELSRKKLAAIFEGGQYGWEGRNHKDSGAFHLGIFDRKMPTERGGVCVRVLPWCAGWGFGHLHFINNTQGYCWAGRNIPKTIFEIAVSPGPLTSSESASILNSVVQDRVQDRMKDNKEAPPPAKVVRPRPPQGDVGNPTNVGMFKKPAADLAAQENAANRSRIGRPARLGNTYQDGETDMIGEYYHHARDVAPSGSILVGVEAGYQDNRIVLLKPIFRSRTGEVVGKAFGRPVENGETFKAKAGYAVGAIFGRHGGGFYLIYMKVKPDGTLDVADNYPSDWIGTYNGEPILIGGTGAPAVGFLATINRNSDLLGLGMLMKTDPASAKPAEAKRPEQVREPNAEADKLPVPEVQAREEASNPCRTQLNMHLKRTNSSGKTDVIGRIQIPVAKDMAPEGGLLVGFEARMPDNSADISVVTPIYRTPADEHRGLTFGRCGDGENERVTVLKAKAGYAVGAMVIQAGLFFEGFYLIYMKVNDDGSLDTYDTYQSDWVGSHRGSRPNLIAGTGEPVIGIQAVAPGMDRLISLGLLVKPTAAK